MTRSLFLYLIFAFSTSLFAAESAPQLRSASALTTSLQKDGYSAQLKEGFHFNDKAPNLVQVDGQSLKPVTLRPRQINFSLPSKYQEAQALLYVCDDQITFCETHKLTIKGSAEEAAKSLEKKKAARPTKDSEGFWEGGLEHAFELANTKNQLVLLDFTARWCPGCVRNKNEVFSTAAFKKISKDLVKVKVDVDQFENFPFSEKYKVKGIPTLILLNANNEEIDRVIGFEPTEKLAPFFKAAQEDPTPAAVLMNTPESAEMKTQLKAGQRLLASGKAAESIPFLSRVQPPPVELLAAKVDAAQGAYEKDGAGKKDLYAKELREAIKAEPGSTRSIAWRTELVKLEPKSDEAKALVKDGSQLADELLKDEAKLTKAVVGDEVGEFQGYEKWVVAMNKADLIEAAEAPEAEQLKAVSEAADLGFAYHIPISKAGPSLRQLSLLSAAHRWTEAEAQANRILKADPKNTDVKRRKIKILNSLSKFDEAIALGEKLIGQVEGRNEFWVAESLAKSYLGSAKKDSAKRLLTAYLARPEMQTEKMKSSKKGMEDLLKTIP
jgi:thiol-disulfide isomerase/thioredoxin